MHSKLFIYYENACHVFKDFYCENACHILKDFKLNEECKIVSHVNVNEFKKEKTFQTALKHLLLLPFYDKDTSL